MSARHRIVNVCALSLVAWTPAAATPTDPLVNPEVQSRHVSPRVDSQQALELLRPGVEVASTDTGRWREFESRDGRFSVQFPGRPVRSEQKTRTDIGYVVSVRFTVTYSKRVTYDLTFSDFPKAQIASVSPQKLLNAARDSLVYQTGGRVKMEAHSLHSTIPSRNLQIIGHNGTRYDVKLLFADDRLYQLLVASQYVAAPDARRFFDSFSLKKTT